jgi:hypothetical protein
VTFESSRGRIIPPNLDDRTWQDLVDEMSALIPKYAPQWTDRNPSDIGVALIELFAWLGEAVIYRLNQVPDKNYIKFLNLIGITRDPAAPADTYLTFTSGVGTVLVPAGTQAQTAAQQGQPAIVFETDEDVTVLPTTLKAAVAIGPYPAGAAASQYDNVSSTLVGPPTAKYLIEVPSAQTMLIALGFDQPVTDTLMVGLRLYLPVTDPSQVSLAWVYSQGTAQPLAWPALPGVADGTESLQHDGQVSLPPPGNWTAQPAPGQQVTDAWTAVTARDPAAAVTDPLRWMGLRITNPATDPNAPPLTIGVDRVLFNAALARTALTVGDETLGPSTGGPFQVFQLQNQPLFRRPGTGPPYADLAVQVGSGSPPDWQDWTLVDDLPPGPGNFYRLDPVAGEISFGNYDDQAKQGHGSVPPSGSQIRAVSYRYIGAGAAGNVAPAQVIAFGVPPAGITNVSNLGPGLDGADEEPIDDTLLRAPEQLKIRDRAVTVDDYEFLAREASTDVAIQRCLTPRVQAAAGPAWQKGDPWTFAGITRAPGNVNMIIVPDQGPSVARPEPTQDLIRDVSAYLEPRRDLTAHLQVLGPRYLPVIVSVALVVWQEALQAGALQAKVEDDTLDQIRAFLHPTRGGPSGTGWQVGQPVFTSDLFRAIMPLEDLGYISTLQVRPDIPAYHLPPLNPNGTVSNFNPALERPFPLSGFGASVRVADYELVCAAADSSHTITSTVAPI